MIHKNHIAGTWCEGTERTTNINPSDLADVIGHYAQAGEDDLEKALDAAREGQQQWADTGLEQRYAVLMSIGAELMKRADELGEQLSREEGKPKAECKGEVYRSGQFFTYYAAEVLRQMGDCTDSVRPGVEVEASREPMGMVDDKQLAQNERYLELGKSEGAELVCGGERVKRIL
jgi:acyl-CoA reductase-like NAD-dependent aldehyde dehydrogenase